MGWNFCAHLSARNEVALNKEFEKKVGNNIRMLRENAKMTQVSLSQILNISNTTLSQYESCVRVPSDEMKIKIGMT